MLEDVLWTSLYSDEDIRRIIDHDNQDIDIQKSVEEFNNSFFTYEDIPGFSE